MKGMGLAGILLAATMIAGSAQGSGDPVFGFWLVEDKRAIIEIAPCGDGACGKIAWLLEPREKDGRPKTDYKNGNAALRGRALCGVPLIRDFHRAAPGRWKGGSIYSPRDGQSYTASMQLRDENTLELRGYVLFPLLGDSQLWTRETGDRGGC